MLTNKEIEEFATHGFSYERFKALSELPQESAKELFYAQGLSVNCSNGLCKLQSATESLSSMPFCVVDIETNGSKPESYTIIEIGAVKIVNGAIVDTFESFAYCNDIREHITEITGISTDDTRNAPPLKEVLEQFRLFLGTAIFVAHDVKFDYSFISHKMQQHGLLQMLNRPLCTIALAERLISSYRYGLNYLNTFLNLHTDAQHHRALSDAYTAAYLLLKLLLELPKKINTAEALIQFSRQAKRLKRPKFDPLKPAEESSTDAALQTPQNS